MTRRRGNCPVNSPDSGSEQNRQHVRQHQRVENFLGEQRPLAHPRQAHRVRLLHLHRRCGRRPVGVSALRVLKLPVPEKAKAAELIRLVELIRFVTSEQSERLENRLAGGECQLRSRRVSLKINSKRQSIDLLWRQLIRSRAPLPQPFLIVFLIFFLLRRRKNIYSNEFSRKCISASLFSDAPRQCANREAGVCLSSKVSMTQVFVAVLSQLTFDRERKITGNARGVKTFAATWVERPLWVSRRWIRILRNRNARIRVREKRNSHVKAAARRFCVDDGSHMCKTDATRQVDRKQKHPRISGRCTQ